MNDTSVDWESEYHRLLAACVAIGIPIGEWKVGRTIKLTSPGTGSLVLRLVGALGREWHLNHSEQCTNEVPHPPTKCLWPMPDVLTEAAKVVAEPSA